MLSKGTLANELAIAVSDSEMVTYSDFRVFHPLALCPVELQSVVSPQRRAEEANASEIDDIVVKEREAYSRCSFSHGSAGCLTSMYANGWRFFLP